jgi:hypothetical protein
VKRYEKAFAELQQSIAQKVDQDPQATPGAPMGLESLSDEERELRRLPIRVHVHCFMRFGRRQRIFLSKDFQLEGSIPCQCNLAQPTGGRKPAAGNGGLHYLQSPKVGSIMSGGASRPYDTYLVKPD